MTDTLARALESDNNGLDRRKLLKIGVWAAPVVVLATATPAAAASPEQLSANSVSVPVTANQTAGNGGRVNVKVQATSTAALTVAVTAVMKITTLVSDKNAPSSLGSWDAPSGATGDTASIARTFTNAGALEFAFVYKVANPHDNYKYTITFSWGDAGKFTKTIEGTIG